MLESHPPRRVVCGSRDPLLHGGEAPEIELQDQYSYGSQSSITSVLVDVSFQENETNSVERVEVVKLVPL